MEDTMSFMTAYWSTVGLLGFIMFWVTAWVVIELSGYKRTFWGRIVFSVDGALLLAIIIGFWLPVTIPGLY